MASGSRLWPRTHHAQKAEETLSILNAGLYTDVDGTVHDISSAITHCIVEARHYSSTELDDFLISCQPPAPSASPSKQHRTNTNMVTTTMTTMFTVLNKTTIQATRELIKSTSTTSQQQQQHVGLLNFASAKHPGGGFLNGAYAQEESLALSSALYPTLTQFETPFYVYNSARERRAMYSDNQIFSPNVPFFRDDDLNLVAPFKASVLTCPAVNYGALISDSDRERAVDVMRSRVWKILCTMRRKGCTDVVLGAFGCGVFGNPVRNVVQMFAELLLDGGPFENVFEKVVFAVYDRDESRALVHFKRRFVGF